MRRPLAPNQRRPVLEKRLPPKYRVTLSHPSITQSGRWNASIRILPTTTIPLARYVALHGLVVRLGVDVRKIDRASDGSGWVIHTTDGPIHARAVVMATGYNRIPYIPDWPGKESFQGELLHGQEYRNGDRDLDQGSRVVGS